MLDDLYGAGAWAEIQTTFAAPAGTVRNFQQIEIEGGGVRVYCSWLDATTGAEIGEAKIDCWADRAHFLTLWTNRPAADRQSILTRLVGLIGDLFERVGVAQVTLSPVSPAVALVFARTGAVPVDERRMAYITLGPDQRRKEYAAWKAGTTPEPAWHVGL